MLVSNIMETQMRKIKVLLIIWKKDFIIVSFMSCCGLKAKLFSRETGEGPCSIFNPTRHVVIPEWRSTLNQMTWLNTLKEQSFLCSNQSNQKSQIFTETDWPKEFQFFFSNCSIAKKEVCSRFQGGQNLLPPPNL